MTPPSFEYFGINPRRREGHDDPFLQLGFGDRLFQIPMNPGLDGVLDVVFPAVSGDDENGDIRTGKMCFLAKQLDEFEAIHVGHFQVADHQIEIVIGRRKFRHRI